MENNFLGITLFGEDRDVPANPTSTNTVVLTKYNGLKSLSNSTFCDWTKVFIFPDDIKANFFLNNFKEGMSNYREGMLKDNYAVHILDVKLPKPERAYVDQIMMSKDYKVREF